MNKIVILHNEHDKTSRDFISNLNDSYQIINWYEPDNKNVHEYISKNMPCPSVFPCVVDTELKYIINCPLTIDEAIEEIDNYTNNLQQQKEYELREIRNSLLASCDWIMLSDSSATAECIDEFKVYRQILRDMDFTLSNLVFPTKPIFRKK